MTEKELTMNIILKMIETGKLSLKEKNAINKEHEEVNTFNTEEVCKAFTTVYKTVVNPLDY